MNRNVLAFIAAIAVSSTVCAQEHEILTTATSGALTFSKAATGTGDETVNVTNLGFGAGYRMLLSDGFQLGGRLAWSSVSSDGASVSTLTLLVGPTFNFGAEDLKDSFFAEGLLGIDRISLKDDEDKYSDSENLVRLSFGKRFALNDSVTYAPELRWSKLLADGAKATVSLNFLAFTFLL